MLPLERLVGNFHIQASAAAHALQSTCVYTHLVQGGQLDTADILFTNGILQ